MERQAKNKRGGAPKGSDYLVKIISVQISICAVIFVLAVCGSKLGGERFAGVADEYRRLNEKDISFSQMKDLISGNKDGEPRENIPDENEETSGDPGEDEKGLPAHLEDEGEETAVQSHDGLYAEGVPVALYNASFTNSSAALSALIKTEPVIPVQGGRVTSGFGYRAHPITGVRHLHAGTDFGADTGDIISAALDGKVTKAEYSSVRGNYIVLSHGSGAETWYCHCSRLLVKEGTVVRAGETIALVGSTGDSNGPHLHLEVHIDGEAKDPMQTLFKS